MGIFVGEVAIQVFISHGLYLNLGMATYAPDHEPESPGEVPEEFKEPPAEKEPEKEPEAGLDAGGAGNDLEAEVLFQVAHYREEYKAPASLADIAFEIAETDPDLHDMVMDAVKEGTPIVGPILKSLVDQGLIMETEFGGYVTTPDGDAMLEGADTQSKLGSTYESDKHKGQPDDTAGYDIEQAAEGGEDEEPPEEKKETGVPFLP
jgi:hypothetical protein